MISDKLISKKLQYIRPTVKTDEEIEAEKNLYFELPRKSCAQMAPSLLKLQYDIKLGKNSEIQHRWHILRKIMKKARVKNIDKDIIPLLANLDASDKVIPIGEVSKAIYMKLFHTRDFDLYGNMKPQVKQPPRKHLEMRYLATQLNIEYTQEIDELFQEPKTAEKIREEEEEKERKELLDLESHKIPKLTTEGWKIGLVEKYNAPVGLSGNPIQPYNSLGNEIYYSYDGLWRNGRMHGKGTYLFADGKTFEGDFENNRQHGYGEAEYPDGHSYSGYWKKGKYDGEGISSSVDGPKYEGNFKLGKRHGNGFLKYPSGLEYRGAFFDGLPHGRGLIKSKLTGWAYDGTFEKGFIKGSGVLITPPPNSERIVYYWSENKENVSLPGIVRYYLKQKEEDRQYIERKRSELNAPLRGSQLRDYVNNIRTTMYAERTREKNQKYNEAIQKAKEQKAKLYEARLRALAGEEEQSEAESTKSERI